MTNEALKALIEGDAQAMEMVQAGNDTGAAERAQVIAPPAITERLICYRTVMGAVSLKASGQLQRTLKMVIAGGPIEGVLDEDQIEGLKTVHALLEGETGINVGAAEARAMLDVFAMNPLLPLKPETASAIKAMAESPEVITARQVSDAFEATRKAAQ